MSSAKAAAMLRAEVTREQVKALKQIALETDTTMQRILGDLITDYLERNGKHS